MDNISIDSEPVFLKEKKYYYFIDALYVMDIKKKLAYVNSMDIDTQLRRVFPYTDTPFAKYKTDNAKFTIERIKKVYYTNIKTDAILFSCDTGLLVVIATELLLDFSKRFNYYELVNSKTTLLNEDYWKNLVSNYDPYDIALILAPGVDSGVDFDGSGTYLLS